MNPAKLYFKLFKAELIKQQSLAFLASRKLSKNTYLLYYFLFMKINLYYLPFNSLVNFNSGINSTYSNTFSV